MPTPPIGARRDPLDPTSTPPPAAPPPSAADAPPPAHHDAPGDTPRHAHQDRSRPHAAASRTPREIARRAPSDDRVVFIGLNASAPVEARHLRRARLIEDAPALEARLSDRAGIEAFVATLRLPPPTAERAADAIEAADPAMRDVIAALARQWAPAERGQRVPSRLVISGHNAAPGLFSDRSDGFLQVSDVTALAQALPRAAAQVEDVHLAACYSGGGKVLAELQRGFPKLRTFWGYRASAPGARAGAIAHLTRWAAATEGRRADLTPSIAAGTRKAESVVTWSAGKGSSLDVSRSAAEALDRVIDGTGVFVAAEIGHVDHPPHAGELREHYDDVMSAFGRPDMPEPDRERLGSYADRVVRLLYYRTHVAPAFQAAHGAALEEAWAALGGTTALDLSTRAALHASATQLRAAMDAHPERVTPAIEAAWRNVQGLVQLSSEVIPARWL